MSASQPLPMQCFDPKADILVVERRLPHWSQAGTISFITWRTHDSMPKAVLFEWHDDRDRWLRGHAVNPDDPNWRAAFERLDPNETQQFRDRFWNRWHDELDAGHGQCVLRQQEVGELVAASLRHFDETRYLLLDYVVMPNHVHLLAAFPDEQAMLTQCESWKHFTATKINRQLNARGRFWQSDSFDHLVRSEEQFQFLRHYIAANPEKAKLPAGGAIHFSRKI